MWEGFDRGWDSMMGLVGDGYGWAEKIGNAKYSSNRKNFALLSGNHFSMRRCIHSERNE